MTKRGELARAIVCIIGGIFAIQLPLFITLLKLVKFSSPCAHPCEDGFSGSYSSWNTSPPTTVGIERSFISNSSHSNEVSSRLPLRPLSVAHYPYVLLSVYRHTLNSFYVLGTASAVVRRWENDQPVYKCEWVATNNGSGGVPSSDSQDSVVTEAQMVYAWSDYNEQPYIPAIVNCTFNQAVGEDGQGGVLRLHVASGPSWGRPPWRVEDVFREEPGEVEKIRRWLQEDEEKGQEELLPYKYAFCGAPLFRFAQHRDGTLKDWTLKWLAYHHYLWDGKAHFYFYFVEGLETAARQILEPWIEAGLLTVIEVPGADEYPAWYHNQALLINDCIYRTRFKARWTFLHDLDELLHIPAPNTIASLLDENRDKPWMSFGSLPFSIDHCKLESSDSSSEEWHLERFLWHKKHPECTKEDEEPWTCAGSSGRRKHVVNPRKVFVSGIHLVEKPEEGGVIFNSSVARVHHFSGITDPLRTVCNLLFNTSRDSEQPDPLEYDIDYALASVMPEVRRFAGSLLPPSRNSDNNGSMGRLQAVD